MAKRIVLPADDPKMGEVLWTTFAVAGRPKSGQWKLHVAVEDKLMDATVEKRSINLKCKTCGTTTDIRFDDIPDMYYAESRRETRALEPGETEVELVLENAECDYLLEKLRMVEPPAKEVKHFLKAQLLLENAPTVAKIKAVTEAAAAG